MRIDVLANPERFVVWTGAGLIMNRESRVLLLVAMVLFLVGGVSLVVHSHAEAWWVYLAAVPLELLQWLPAHRHNRRLRKARTVQPTSKTAARAS